MARNDKKKDDDVKDICRNRRAFHEYEMLDRLECGIVLTGTEVKSLRDGHASLEDAYARIDGRRSLADRQRHSRVRDGQPDEPQAQAAAQAAAASPRDRQVRRQGVAEGLHAGAAAAVLQERPGQGRDGGLPRQAKFRQTAGTEESRRPERDSPGHEDGGVEKSVNCSLPSPVMEDRVHLVALVHSLDHVCCRYRLAAFRAALADAGHSLVLRPLPRRWWDRWSLLPRSSRRIGHPAAISLAWLATCPAAPHGPESALRLR